MIKSWRGVKYSRNNPCHGLDPSDSVTAMAELMNKIDDTEMDLLRKVDEAIVRAGELMEMADISDEDEDEYDSVYEARFHCGKCIVSTVMETIWDDLKNLMDYYEAKEPVKG